MTPRIMAWYQCEEEFIRSVEKDSQRIKSIVLRANQRLKLIKTLKLNEETVSFIVEGYYEVIKEMLVAYLLKDGIRSRNHQCLISYFLKQNPQHENEAHLIAQTSLFRNRLGYYGESIPFDFYLKNKNNFIKVINLLRRLLTNKGFD